MAWKSFRNILGLGHFLAKHTFKKKTSELQRTIKYINSGNNYFSLYCNLMVILNQTEGW